MDTEIAENPGFDDPDGIHREPSPLIAALAGAAEDIERYAVAAINEERWPLIRLGGRQKISRVVRRLVFERDGGCCLNCGMTLTIRTAQLDHIVPWSAGGPDFSENLRILCEPCNADRSNFRTGLDDHAARRPPVALCCIACVHLDDQGAEIADPLEVTPELVPAYCGWCGVVSPTWPEELY
jgi:HNH endonuclease